MAICRKLLGYRLPTFIPHFTLRKKWGISVGESLNTKAAGEIDIDNVINMYNVVKNFDSIEFEYDFETKLKKSHSYILLLQWINNDKDRPVNKDDIKVKIMAETICSILKKWEITKYDCSVINFSDYLK